MDILLSFFILLAIICVVFSIVVFKRQSKVRAHSDGWSMQKDGEHIRFNFKNVHFSAHCDYGSDGDGLNRQFVVKTINIHLNGHPSILAGWTKGDLYTIEQYLLASFPHSNILWEEPMSSLISEEK